MPANLKNSEWPQDWKKSVFISIPRKAMPKNIQTAAQLHSSYMLAFSYCSWVLKTTILKWFAIPFSSGPHFVRTFHHDLSILHDPTWHDL